MLFRVPFQVLATLSDAYTADELYKAMLAKGKTDNRPELVWKPLKDRL
ncbi:hypothetical protein M124_4071 [Bacteroides fragilis str. 3988T(B)14]|uniref:Uncharacterized protein n=2 Tax=Bacteroides fragilis str. 3988T(B)14 TaxID=1339315 RepID=A0A015UT97_BACFG|nr:hypothetical protein M124_4071 [Bacteroides fragilis str. 3988T(B)14]EXY77708.1 hypothetical protein M084_4582 [Bacteroides fragilis str. 3988 T1]EXY77744.1 hypothetical protein M084_4546 [Bacteroides fragilis str. 3988 T1]